MTSSGPRSGVPVSWAAAEEMPMTNKNDARTTRQTRNVPTIGLLSSWIEAFVEARKHGQDRKS
jgi:hypothetical protein